MKSCKNCRFFDGQKCAVTQKKTHPNNSCSSFSEYKGK